MYSSEIKIKFKNTFEVLLKYHSVSKKDQLDEIFEIWYEVFKSKVRVYSTLSTHFFNLSPESISETGQDVEIFLGNILILKQIASDKDIDDLENFHNFLDKIVDHIELIGIQVTRIDTNVDQVKETKDDLLKEITQLKTEIKNKQKELSKLKDKQDGLKEKQIEYLKKAKKVQKEFVTILGIFATILITTFGGLTSLASIFNNINSASTGKIVLLGSFVVYTVILIVFLLLNGISKLSELNIRSCGCEVNTPCTCPISKKHPTLYIVTVMLVVTSLLGVSEYLVDYKLLFGNYDDWVILLLLGIFIILVPILAFTYFHDANNRKA